MRCFICSVGSTYVYINTSAGCRQTKGRLFYVWLSVFWRFYSVGGETCSVLLIHMVFLYEIDTELILVYNIRMYNFISRNGQWKGEQWEKR